MCRAATCNTCGKTTWAGCGQHVAEVKRSVPASNWCNGQHTRAQLEAAHGQRGGGFFSRIFSR